MVKFVAVLLVFRRILTSAFVCTLVSRGGLLLADFPAYDLTSGLPAEPGRCVGVQCRPARETPISAEAQLLF